MFSLGFTDFVIANGSGTYSLGAETDAALFSISSAGIVTLQAGELDFDNATDANFDGVYEFSVTYTNGAGSESVTEDVVLTITDTATVSASTNSATTTLTVQEAETVNFESAGTDGVLSDAFKEFVAADTPNATSGYTLTGTDNGDFSINSSTGAVSVVTGAFDFENPADADTSNDYEFVITYTNSTGNTFAETITLNVTNNAITDASINQTDQELSTTGRSSIQVSADSTNDFFFDIAEASHRDLLSQGAKDFIDRHTSDTLATAELFYGFENAATDQTANNVANSAVSHLFDTTGVAHAAVTEAALVMHMQQHQAPPARFFTSTTIPLMQLLVRYKSN